jgi:undecaprenyl-diphosphatase
MNRSRWYSTLAAASRHTQGLALPVLLFAGLGLLVGALGVLIIRITAALAGPRVTRFDEAALQWFETRRTPLLDRAMLELTTLGNMAVVGMVVLVAAVFLYVTRHRYSALLLMVAAFGGMALNSVLKLYFHRPRPAVVGWATEVHSPSFPSGHALTALAAYGAVAYLVGRLEPSSRLRWLSAAVAALLIAGIGVSRLYLGVHYPSDVLAGFAVGAVWVAYVVAGIALLRFLAQGRAQVRSDERDL